ncbi:MAG: hypothetical protein KAJ91_01725 [Candidatus Aenigmarchaeota archaeon]|nr:hypothetical protein [Candidatus Aenigmarchaeota archaeon]
MDKKATDKIQKNLHALAKKHDVSAKLFLDEKEVLNIKIKKDTVYLDSKNVLKLLTTPALIKLGLALRSGFGGKYKIRMKQGFIKRVLGKE